MEYAAVEPKKCAQYVTFQIRPQKALQMLKNAIFNRPFIVYS